VALFSLSIFALVTVAISVDATDLQQRRDAPAPRRPVALFLAALALLLTGPWLGQIIPFLTTGTLPELIIRAKTSTNFVYVLDPGLVVPLALLAATWI
jgi:hypothetical protein